MGSQPKDKAVFDTEAGKEMVKELRASFVDGKTKSYEWKESQLKAMLKMMEENEGQIVYALRDDLSKPELESSIYEIGMLQNSCRLALKEMKHWMKPKKAKTSLTTFPSSAEIVSEPLGVVLVISAWNYPFLLSLDPVVGAIAAGNAIVLKPSELAPATSSLLAKLIADYLDGSCIKVVEGGVPETSALLEQKWDKIFYTGNGRVARIVMAAAAKHLTPVVLELGGKSPVIVDSDIDLKVATRRIIAGKWGCNNGQACISPDYIITTKEYALELVDKLEASFDVIKSLGGKPLAAYLFTNKTKLKEKFVAEVSAGGLVINDTTVHLAEHNLPFGGVGDSGMGSYHGKFSFDAFSHKKGVLYKGFGGDSSLRYPPYTQRKLRLLQALLSGSVLRIIRALLGF